MKPMKILMIVLVLLGPSGWGSSPSRAGSTEFTLLYTNDTLGEVEPCG